MQYRKKSDDEGGGYTVAWLDIMQHWDLVECDLLETYGIDTWNYETMNITTWPWLKRKIMGLLSVDTRITNWAKNKAK